MPVTVGLFVNAGDKGPGAPFYGGDNNRSVEYDSLDDRYARLLIEELLPAIAALLIVNLAFGVIARSAPQFNIFSIGFPVMILFGLVVLVFTIGFLIAMGLFIWWLVAKNMRGVYAMPPTCHRLPRLLILYTKTSFIDSAGEPI